MKNESSAFDRKTYIEDLAARANEPPIGKKMTHIEILREYAQREFMDFPLGTHTRQKGSAKIDKSIYPHQTYPDLFFETCFIDIQRDETPSNDDRTEQSYNCAKPIISVYDFINGRMLIAQQKQDASTNAEEKKIIVAPLSTLAKRRLYEDYDLNAFSYKPFDTIETLLDMVPPSHYASSQSEESRRLDTAHKSKWLTDYARAMFDIKACDGKTAYALPLFDNAHVICVATVGDGPKDRTHLEIQDIAEGRILDIRSEYEEFPLAFTGCRDYTITHRAMTQENITCARNILFLTGKNDMLGADKVLDVRGINLPDKSLPQTIDIKTINLFNPK